MAVVPAPADLKVAVLGCGPTGLLTAWGVTRAAEELDLTVEISIFSAKRKSPLYGCQYLHSPIPGLELGFQQVHYQLVGSLDGYREKVYGAAEDVEVSPSILDAVHGAWDLRAAYDQLWERFEPGITDYFFSQGSWRLLDHRLQADGTDLVFSSLPAPALCRDKPGCTFASTNVWAMGDAPALNRWAAHDAPPRTIVCNGDPQVDWYRASNVFGHRTVEWPEEATPPRGASRVAKPLHTGCECNPDVIRVGRYGKWEKGALSHTAFHEGFAGVGRWVKRKGWTGAVREA